MSTRGWYEYHEMDPATNRRTLAMRYLSNRTEQIDYKGALANGLLIGSGEIESALLTVSGLWPVTALKSGWAGR